jgi:hypothetical protein
MWLVRVACLIGGDGSHIRNLPTDLPSGVFCIDAQYAHLVKEHLEYTQWPYVMKLNQEELCSLSVETGMYPVGT